VRSTVEGFDGVSLVTSAYAFALTFRIMTILSANRIFNEISPQIWPKALDGVDEVAGPMLPVFVCVAKIKMACDRFKLDRSLKKRFAVNARE
jgi:hypothetical protein